MEEVERLVGNGVCEKIMSQVMDVSRFGREWRGAGWALRRVGKV